MYPGKWCRFGWKGKLKFPWLPNLCVLSALREDFLCEIVKARRRQGMAVTGSEVPKWPLYLQDT